MPEIILNPMNQESEDRMRKALTAIAEVMNVEIAVETLSVVKITWKNTAVLMDIIKNLSGNSIAKEKKASNRYTNPSLPSKMVMDEDIDPLGS